MREELAAQARTSRLREQVSPCATQHALSHARDMHVHVAHPVTSVPPAADCLEQMLEAVMNDEVARARTSAAASGKQSGS